MLRLRELKNWRCTTNYYIDYGVSESVRGIEYDMAGFIVPSYSSGSKLMATDGNIPQLWTEQIDLTWNGGLDHIRSLNKLLKYANVTS